MADQANDDTGRIPVRPVRAYSYVRMSTQRQLRGDSLRRQLEKSRAFADEHSLLLDDSLQDLGVSAWKGRNARSGALGRFLVMVETGEIPKGSYLLIESLDRLSREAVPDALTLFMAIINAGIVIATLGDDRQIYSRDSLNGDWTKLIIGLAVMSRGHEESRTKSERIGAAHRRRRDEAREGKAQITGRTPAWIDATRVSGNRYDFSLNAHAATVRTIYDMASRGLGATAIARMLNADNVPTFRDADGWHPAIIRNLLSRRDVVGTFQPHRLIEGKRVIDGDAIEDYFPAVIDKDVYLRVQAMRGHSGRPGRRGTAFANLFTGLCRCSHCGGPMGMKMNRLRVGMTHYLVCRNYARGRHCTEGRRNFRYDRLEDGVLRHLTVLNLAEVIRSRRNDGADGELRERIAALTLQRDELLRREQRLAHALENDGKSFESVIALLHRRQAERQQVESELQKRVGEMAGASRQNHLPHDTDHIARLQEAWIATEDEQQRYRLRAEAHAAIREFVTCIAFDSIDDTAMAVIANGVMAYTFRNGAMIRMFDAFNVPRGELKPGRSTAWS